MIGYSKRTLHRWCIIRLLGGGVSSSTLFWLLCTPAGVCFHPITANALALAAFSRPRNHSRLTACPQCCLPQKSFWADNMPAVCLFPLAKWFWTTILTILLPQYAVWRPSAAYLWDMLYISTYIFLKGFLEGLQSDLRVAGRSKVSKTVLFYMLLGSWAVSRQGPQMRRPGRARPKHLVYIYIYYIQ